MKTLNDLMATAGEAVWTERRGIVTTIHHEVRPGLFVHVGLGPAGLVIRRDKDMSVGIPLDELVKLAATHLPDLGGALAEAAPVADLKSDISNLKADVTQ